MNKPIGVQVSIFYITRITAVELKWKHGIRRCKWNFDGPLPLAVGENGRIRLKDKKRVGVWAGGGILSESIANHAPAINPNDDHPMDATAIAINSKL